MPTKIYSANIKVGSKQLLSYPVKKLPVNILLSDTFFIKRLKRIIGDREWKKQTVKGAAMPRIEIEYLQFLGEVIHEPKLPI